MSLAAQKDLVPSSPSLPPAQISPVTTEAIPDKAKDVALARYRLVHTFRDVMKNAPWGEKKPARKAFLLAYNSGFILSGIHIKVGPVTYKTVSRWDKQLKDSGDDWTAVADGRGGWRVHGTTRFRERKIPPEAQEVMLKCWLQGSRPTFKTAAGSARIKLKERGLDDDFSDATLRRWLNDWMQKNEHIWVLAREGEKAYQDKVGPYITRDSSVLNVGDVLIADGHDLNFLIRHPDTGRPCRMKLVVFYDWASRYPVGFQIATSEDTICISAALRRSILTIGKIPLCVYLDNGRGFKAKIFTNTNADLRELVGIYARLGIAVTFAMKYNARAKIVERFFSTFNEQYERLMPSYTGACIADKPPWMLQNERFHKMWHKARTRGWVPNVAEAANIIAGYIQWYGNQPHRGLKGQKPIDVLTAGLGPGVDEQDLREQFLWRTKRKPSRCRVSLMGIHYEGDCLHGIGHDVLIKYDTSNMGEAFVYSPDNIYMGEVYPVEALHPMAKLLGDKTSLDKVKRAIARQRRLKRQTKQALGDLGVSPKTVEETLEALPFNKRVAVIPGGRKDTEKTETPALSAEDRKQLELVAERAAAEEVGPVGEPRPEYFAYDVDRYDWCFKQVYQYGAELSAADAEFMGAYELMGEFKANYAGHYEDLRRLYEEYGAEAVNL